MDRAELRRLGVAVLEVLGVDRAAFERALVRQQTKLPRPKVHWRLERFRRQTARGAAHEVAPDRQRHASAGATLADLLRLIEAGPHADDNRGVETDEPGIAVIV